MEEVKKEKEAAHDAHKASKSTAKRVQLKRLLVTLPIVLLAVVGLAVSYVYAVSPAVIRNPKMEHLHFRMQLVVDGKAVDFGQDQFQTPYAKDQCSGELAASPIHFHDKKNQFVHIHWAGITGGIVLKNYGWNLIGGRDNVLGYRLDDLPRIKSVPIHGNSLPALPDKATFWVYTGDEHGYQKRSFDDFKKQGLEEFLGQTSNFPKAVQASDGVMSWLFPRAYAHGTESHDTTAVDATEEERLTRINNLIGNVVIFVQQNEPRDQQIKAKFANLEPLSDSTCGG